jgi:hypothetical protein
MVLKIHQFGPGSRAIIGRDDEAVWLDPAVEDVARLQPMLKT